MTITPIHPDDLEAAFADDKTTPGTARRSTPGRRTFGRWTPVRRTLALRGPTRRTLGYRVPTRRTLGRRVLPTRRTLGRGFGSHRAL